jgi:hypothetical protein
MTLEEVKAKLPTILVPHALAVYEAMIAAEQGLGGVDLPECKGQLLPPGVSIPEKRIDPLAD